jgi:hypothetical protein
MPDPLEIALREFENINTHTYLAMKAASLAMMGCIDPPQLIARTFLYPPNSGNQIQYVAVLTVENANLVQGLMQTKKSADEIAIDLFTRIGQINKFYNIDVLTDLYAVLTTGAPPPKVPAAPPPAATKSLAKPGGGGEVPLGCCTVDGTSMPNLSEAQCSAFGSSAGWNPQNPDCAKGARDGGSGPTANEPGDAAK